MIKNLTLNLNLTTLTFTEETWEKYRETISWVITDNGQIVNFNGIFDKSSADSYIITMNELKKIVHDAKNWIMIPVGENQIGFVPKEIISKFTGYDFTLSN